MMKARNRITLIAIIFFSCLLIIDCYRITDVLRIQLKSVQLRLQFINTEDDYTNHDNSFAEFPENDISFDTYSKLSDSKSDILQYIIYELHFQRNPNQHSGFTHNINLNHLIICNLDLPPPFFFTAVIS